MKRVSPLFCNNYETLQMVCRYCTPAIPFVAHLMDKAHPWSLLSSSWVSVDYGTSNNLQKSLRIMVYCGSTATQALRASLDGRSLKDFLCNSGHLSGDFNKFSSQFLHDISRKCSLHDHVSLSDFVLDC